MNAGIKTAVCTEYERLLKNSHQALAEFNEHPLGAGRDQRPLRGDEQVAAPNERTGNLCQLHLARPKILEKLLHLVPFLPLMSMNRP